TTATQLLKYLGFVGDKEPFTSTQFKNFVDELRQRGVGVSGLITNVECIAKSLVDSKEKDLEDFITELKQFLMEQRVIKKTNLKKEKRLLCPQSQAIEKFLSSQDVTKVLDQISK
uniref:Uncharacterized protein n=1 Tax=Amphimedon queenslandica TaxID=400682 RepID=A0A1X7TAY6_AMPQE